MVPRGIPSSHHIKFSLLDRRGPDAAMMALPHDLRCIPTSPANKIPAASILGWLLRGKRQATTADNFPN